MTTATAPRPTTPSADPRTAVFAAGGLLLAALIVLAGNLIVHTGESGGAGPAMASGIICVLAAGLLFTLVVPRMRSARTAQQGTIVLAVLTLLSLVVFWVGISPVFAAATLAVAERSPRLGRAAKTLRVLAVLAAVLAIGWSVANSHWF